MEKAKQFGMEGVSRIFAVLTTVNPIDIMIGQVDTHLTI